MGSYAINAGTLSAGSNYTISLAANNAALTITPATLTVTADSETKTYGQDDPTLTYSVSGYQFSDTAAVLTGSLSRVAGEEHWQLCHQRGHAVGRQQLHHQSGCQQRRPDHYPSDADCDSRH